MSIHQKIIYQCNSHRIFEVLTNAKQFSEFTGAPAEIDPEAGGKFSCFDGMISGMTIEIALNQLLVQAWRVGNWEPGIYSIVKFEFDEKSDSETKVVFDHTGFPEEHRAHLEQGWHDMYWEPIRKYLGG